VTTRDELIQSVEEVYAWIDAQAADMGPGCTACGECCDFDKYGHRLFITTPEMIYFTTQCPKELRPMADGACPYREAGKCTVRDWRFAACRIFQCKGDARRQARLSEEAVGKFKTICRTFEVPYRYTDLQAALHRPELWIG